MMRMPVLALAAMIPAAQATAAEIVIPLPEGTEVQSEEIRYDCGDHRLMVTYINAGPVSLAVFEVDGEAVVASNVISGSGARYAGSRYVWWSKGDDADLYDLMRGEDTPMATCDGRG